VSPEEAERIFVRIAREPDGGVPSSRQWHREILRETTLEPGPEAGGPGASVDGAPIDYTACAHGPLQRGRQ
jgi:hypothetical protein